MGDLDGTGGTHAVDGFGDGFEGGDMVVGPDAEVLGGDSAFGEGGGCFGHDEAASSGGATGEVVDVPGGSEAVFSFTGVSAHRREGDAVAEGEGTQGEGGEEGGHALYFVRRLSRSWAMERMWRLLTSEARKSVRYRFALGLSVC